MLDQNVLKSYETKLNHFNPFQMSIQTLLLNCLTCRETQNKSAIYFLRHPRLTSHGTQGRLPILAVRMLEIELANFTN